MSRYSWRMVFEDFKNTYPDLWKRGTSYEPSNFMEINIFIPGDGKYKYDYYGKKLTLVEKYLTIEQERYLKVFKREEAVRKMAIDMRERKVTQRKLSQVSGISRESINAYISGRKTPKQSTLDKLTGAMNKIGEED